MCLFSIFQKTEKMFLKKKNANHYSQQKLQIGQTLTGRKTYQKHSRQGTKDLPKYFYSVILKVHKRSAQTCRQEMLGYQISTLVLNESNLFTINTKEVSAWSDSQEYLKSYHILSKHDDKLKDRPSIETNLFQAIRSKDSQEFQNKPLPHYQSHIYPIMKHYASKMKKLKLKRKQQNCSSIHNFIQTYKKELPTHINSNEREQSKNIENNNQGSQSPKVDLSESYEIKALADCIKQMFIKQGVIRGQLGVSKINENSWLKQRRKSEEKNFIDCDFSSIEGQSKFDLMIQSRIRKIDCAEAEETYGLGELKKRYEEQKMSQLKESSGFKGLGHKRNPTEAVHCKKEFQIYDPLTPKQHPTKSAFGSSKNILPSVSEKQSKSNSRDKSPFLLKFEKQKKSKQNLKIGLLKQNRKELRLKPTKLESRSKSKSKEKLSFRSNLSKAQVKRY